MEDHLDAVSKLSPAKRALVVVRQLRAKLERLERADREPIAIIGIGCRFPGDANGPKLLWEMLCNEVDAVSLAPPGRFTVASGEDASGDSASIWGGFLADVDRFDREFFGIQAEEASLLDPQQRLVLEVTWEALEDAGIPVDHLRGSQTGVFIGSSTNDYILALQRDHAEHDGFKLLSGSSHSVASARVAYFLDLRGPCLTIDTACSSALVAVQNACESLRRSESALAIAGGTNAILLPFIEEGFRAAGMLSPDGRCRPFDLRANGFARSEGCGVVVLKRLSEALADGDRVYATIRGWAVNHNGRGPGLVIPHGAAQEDLTRKALQRADVTPNQIGYVEAHGTGTPLGDSIEAAALRAVFGAPRENGRPCLIGSVKANLGHLEAASGIASLIKAALILENQAIPPQIHFQELHPDISLDNTPLAIEAKGASWPASDVPRFASVQSLSFSGTNVHLVLQDVPPLEARDNETRTEWKWDVEILPLSAKNPEALSTLAASHAKQLRQAGRPEHGSLRDHCYSSAVRRTHHSHRLAVVGHGPETIAEALDAFVSNTSHADLFTGSTLPSHHQRYAFVFPGIAARELALGTELLETEPVFREAVEQCDQAVGQHVEGSLLEELATPSDRSGSNDAELGVAVLFAFQLGLATLWRSWGIRPDAVLGCGAGELAAACVAGALKLEDAALFAVRETHTRRDADHPRGIEQIQASPPDRLASIPFHSVSAEGLEASIRDFSEKGFRTFLEVGVRSVLDTTLRRVAVGDVPLILPVGPGARPERECLHRELAALYVNGAGIDWARVQPSTGRFVRLPRYPWTRERCWYSRRVEPSRLEMNEETKNL